MERVMEKAGQAAWSETVVLADADYMDRVAFDLIVNFERMIERRIPPADLARWLDCAVLDGGLRPGDNAVQAVFLHDKARQAFAHFVPSRFADELDGQAFRDNLGEFSLFACAVEDIVSPADFYVQSLETLLAAPAVQRLVLVPDMETYGQRVRRVLSADHGKDVTLLAMEPQPGTGFAQELLGYSLMNALGIRADELR